MPQIFFLKINIITIRHCFNKYILSAYYLPKELGVKIGQKKISVPVQLVARICSESHRRQTDK